MDTDRTVDQLIQTEIERLRGQFPQTQDIYREACILLFFRFGITPTANKLYQLVRKGSMSAPAEALTKFWENLREKSRVRIEHPDLPEELKEAAGDLTATLWTQAQALAQEALARYRAEAQATSMEAKAAQTTAEADRDSARRDLETAQESLRKITEHARTLEQRLAAEGATRVAREAQFERSAQEIIRLQTAQDQARVEFSAELDKLRAAGALAEERFRASEERALVEIDRERTASNRLQKELNQARMAANQAADRHRAEIASLQTEFGKLRQQTGLMEGSLQAALAGRDRISDELDQVRSQLTEAIAQKVGLRVEVDNWRHKTEEAHQEIAEIRAKAGRRTRKPAATHDEGKVP